MKTNQLAKKIQFQESMVSKNSNPRHGKANNTLITGVKRWKIDNVEFCYHRKSGIPLPPLSPSNPRFQLAFSEAEAVYQNRLATHNTRLIPMPQDKSDHSPPIVPDAIIFKLDQARSWAYSAKKGEVGYYHYGTIGSDQINSLEIENKRRYFSILADLGLVALRQKRVSDQNTHYYAIRTESPIRYAPQNVLSGTVDPIGYSAVRAVLERQASMSVARCLRAALDLSEAAAIEYRDKMIRSGWLTNQRPPELTVLGMSVLA